MIPYDDLVAALSAWRSRQGLPVSTMGGAAPTTTQPGSGPHASIPAGTQPGTGSGPRTSPPMAPPRGGPPVLPQRGGAMPPPLAPGDDLDVDEAALLDESHYENEGGDFAMQFDGDGGQTAIGGPPSPPPGSKRNRNDDW